jgi:hypothetical protein
MAKFACFGGFVYLPLGEGVTEKYLQGHGFNRIFLALFSSLLSLPTLCRNYKQGNLQ